VEKSLDELLTDLPQLGGVFFVTSSAGGSGFFAIAGKTKILYVILSLNSKYKKSRIYSCNCSLTQEY
jgi:hypothetical protein